MIRAILLICLAGLIGAPDAIAQTSPGASPSELRRENDLLRERLHALEAAITQMQVEIARLTKLVETQNELLIATRAELESERSRRMAAERNGGSAPVMEQPPPQHLEPESTPAPEIDLSQHPFAAPDALFEALQREYVATMGALPYETPEEREAYLREVRRWINQIKLHRRSAVEWLVELKSMNPLDAQLVDCEFQALWPKTGEPIGEPFMLELAGRDALRVLEDTAPSRWVISATFSAAPVLNESRLDRGVFNTPRFVGPFVEFDYELTVRSIRPAPEEVASK